MLVFSTLFLSKNRWLGGRAARVWPGLVVAGATRGAALPQAAVAVALTLLAASHAARAQAPADSLTGRAHRLPEARVRAVRLEKYAVGSTRIEVDSATLAQYRGGTAADLLGPRLGLYVKNYGPGQLATLSLRGTSAQHTAVLWNGLNIALPTLGQNDLALLPLGANTELTVQPGPAAALYGSGAIGGALLLRTDPDYRPSLRGTVQADAGSYGLRGTSLEARAASATVAVRVAASYRQALNNYPYYVQEPAGPVRYTLQNAALRHQYSLAPDLAWRVGAAGELTAAAWLTEADRQLTPGSVASSSQASELDASRRFVLGYRRALAGGGQWSVRGAWFEDVLNYTDYGGTERSRVRTSQTQADYNHPLGARASLRLGLEAQHFAALVDGYGGQPLSENRAAAFALLRFDPRPSLRLSANLRQAALPGGLAPLAPTLGAEYDLLGGRAADSTGRAGLLLKASAARSYRAPTLNERYWQPGGNPALRPESGGGYETGLRGHWGQPRRLALGAELTAYRQLVDDWVQWLPLGPGGAYSPRNLRRVRSQGLEASADLALRRGSYRAGARASYAFTQTQKTQGSATDTDPTGLQLAYVPLHRAALSTDQQWRHWLGSVAYSFASYVYTTNSADTYLAGGGLLSATLGRTVRWPGHRTSVTVLAQGFNLLGRRYESYPARPGPPRTAQLTLRLNYN